MAGNNSIYPKLAVICTICIIAVAVVIIEYTITSQIRSVEDDNSWADSLDDLEKYGGTIYYGSIDSFKISTTDSYTGPTDYWDNKSSASPDSGRYGFKVSLAKSILIIEWKSWTDNATYNSGHYPNYYHHQVTFKDNSLFIPVDSIRYISISHNGTK